MDLKSRSKAFKTIHDKLDKAYSEQHPYSGYFILSKFGWQSLEFRSEAGASWLFSLMEYVDMLEKRLEENEKRIQDLEKKAVFI